MNKTNWEEFDKLCIVNKDGDCKYWKPEAFGYKDMECSMDKFFPQEVKEKLLESVQQKIDEAYQLGFATGTIESTK